MTKKAEKILGLRTTIYKVDDIQKAKQWYAKALGTEPYFDEPFYIGFNIKRYELGLQPYEKKEVKKGDSVMVYCGVEDIHLKYKQLINLGATIFEAPENVGGSIMVTAVKDPWENIIGLIYNPEFKIQ